MNGPYGNTGGFLPNAGGWGGPPQPMPQPPAPLPTNAGNGSPWPDQAGRAQRLTALGYTGPLPGSPELMAARQAGQHPIIDWLRANRPNWQGQQEGGSGNHYGWGNGQHLGGWGGPQGWNNPGPGQLPPQSLPPNPSGSAYGQHAGGWQGPQGWGGPHGWQP